MGEDCTFPADTLPILVGMIFDEEILIFQQGLICGQCALGHNRKPPRYAC